MYKPIFSQCYLYLTFGQTDFWTVQCWGHTQNLPIAHPWCNQRSREPLRGSANRKRVAGPRWYKS